MVPLVSVASIDAPRSNNQRTATTDEEPQKMSSCRSKAGISEHVSSKTCPTGSMPGTRSNALSVVTTRGPAVTWSTASGDVPDMQHTVSCVAALPIDAGWPLDHVRAHRRVPQEGVDDVFALLVACVR